MICFGIVWLMLGVMITGELTEILWDLSRVFFFSRDSLLSFWRLRRELGMKILGWSVW